jgi:hypothetical protein
MIWKTQSDTHVCPTCKALEGYTWELGLGDPYPKQLSHPIYGPVYDTRPAVDASMVEESKGHICRCRLKHELHVSKKLASSNLANSKKSA